MSEKLQNQITVLCRRVPDVEWSGVLFYTTEGEFGMDDFKIHCHELMLMDIGSSAYTEYDFGPEFVGRLMQKPHLLKMKKGHIHSHNTMSVFFSGTDDSELLENTQFHNIYVSLIVNNRNDMTAKVAFEARQEALSIKFKDENGQEKYRHIEGTETLTVLAYPCKVIKPVMVGTEDLDKDAEAIMAAKRSRGTSFSTPFSSKSQGSFAWEKDEKEEKGEKTKPKKSEEKGSNAVRKPIPGKRVQKGFTEKRLYWFTIAMLTRDYNVEEGRRLTDVLADLQESYKNLHGQTFQKYLDEFIPISLEYYEYFYPEDKKYENFDETMCDVQSLVESFAVKYPELIDRLVDNLDIVYVDDGEELVEEEEQYPKTVSYGEESESVDDAFDNSNEFPV